MRGARGAGGSMAHTQKAVKSVGFSQLGHYQLRSAEKAAEVRPLLVFSLRLRLQQWSPRRAGESENPHDDFPLTCNWQKGIQMVHGKQWSMLQA